MAFPTTAVLDNFNRANETQLSGSWSPFYECAGANDWGVSSNQLYPADSAFNGYRWTTATGADCEVYITISTYASPSGTHIVFVRLKDTTCGLYQYDAYRVYAFKDASNQLVRIGRVDNSVNTQLGSSFSTTLADSDQLGCRIVGSTIYAFLNGTELGSRTDSTYAAAGDIGWYGDGVSSQRYEDFGGGTYSGQAARALYHLRQQGIS